jgi:hypothetical protein
VNGPKESHIDKIIRDEIMKMFDEGTTTEAALNKLDRKLEYLIKKARSKSTPDEVNYGSPYGDKKSDDARSIGARSIGSQGALMMASNRNARVSHSNDFGVTRNSANGGLPSVITKPKVGDNMYNGHRLVYEDPSAVMNVSEGQWNDIVLKNLEDFKNEN